MTPRTSAAAARIAPATTEVVERLRAGDRHREVLGAALLARGAAQQALFALARERREACFPSREVEVRSVVEISNACRQRCAYCSMAAGAAPQRYLLDEREIVSRLCGLRARGRRVVVLQSGERGDGLFVGRVAAAVAAAKARHPDLRIILGLGTLPPARCRELRAAGADGYILKFETSSAALYARAKPGDSLSRRLECLEALIDAGFAVGSGNIVGLPGQTLDDLVGDLELLGRYPLAMQSTTPFIPGEGAAWRAEPAGDVDAALGFMALMRILHPPRLVPTTSALEKARRGGQLEGLLAGANVVTAHDGTPDEVRRHYAIYSTSRFEPLEDHLAAAVRAAGLDLPAGAP
jgi:biotin synthase